jgi:porphobilinogen synthase
MRNIVRETQLNTDKLICPLFVQNGTGIKTPIPSMPGIFHFSPDTAYDFCKNISQKGIKAVILFGIPDQKDEFGSHAWRKDSPVVKLTGIIKSKIPELIVITDVCLCAYTTHGHCGVLDESGNISNDKTLPLLSRTAVAHAEAGADIVAPSDMMDGRVGLIRKSLDDYKLQNTAIMSYSAKYASAYYGPFRDAANSSPQSGDRKSYQMDPANIREALREIKLDEEEGADFLMVKPALAYLDVIKTVKGNTSLPVTAYNVSGEYSMVKAAAANGWVDEKHIVLENLTAITRAGADQIISYHAPDAADWINKGNL